MREPISPHFHYDPLGPDTLWTRGFVVMLFACVVAGAAVAYATADWVPFAVYPLEVI